STSTIAKTGYSIAGPFAAPSRGRSQASARNASASSPVRITPELLPYQHPINHISRDRRGRRVAKKSAGIGDGAGGKHRPAAGRFEVHDFRPALIRIQPPGQYLRVFRRTGTHLVRFVPGSAVAVALVQDLGAEEVAAPQTRPRKNPVVGGKD